MRKRISLAFEVIGGRLRVIIAAQTIWPSLYAFLHIFASRISFLMAFELQDFELFFFGVTCYAMAYRCMVCDGEYAF